MASAMDCRATPLALSFHCDGSHPSATGGPRWSPVPWQRIADGTSQPHPLPGGRVGSGSGFAMVAVSTRFSRKGRVALSGLRAADRGEGPNGLRIGAPGLDQVLHRATQASGPRLGVAGMSPEAARSQWAPAVRHRTNRRSRLAAARTRRWSYCARVASKNRPETTPSAQV